MRANSLAAAGDEIGGDVRDNAHGRVGLARKLPLDRSEIVAEQVKDLGRGRDGDRTHCLFRVAGEAMGGIASRANFRF